MNLYRISISISIWRLSIYLNMCVNYLGFYYFVLEILVFCFENSLEDLPYMNSKNLRVKDKYPSRYH